MGSANLNDRSMWGTRDSELACLIVGEPDTEIHYNHKNYPVNSKILDFRVSLFKEHFGLAIRDILFQNSKLFWTKARNLIKTNTYFYDQAFKVLPSDLYPTWKSVKEREKKFDKEAFTHLKGFVKGHAVLYPYDFLKDEKDLIKASMLLNTVLPIRTLY